MSKKWKNSEVQQAVRDLVGTDTYEHVATQLTKRFGTEFTGESVRKWYKRHSFAVIEPCIPTLFEWPEIQEHLEEIYRHSLTYRKIGIISDLHIPFHDEVFICKAVDHIISAGCDVLVIAGDAMDQFAFSSFADNTAIPLGYEYDILKDFILSVKDKIDIVLVKGNHEYRLENELSKKTRLDQYAFLFDNGSPDALWQVANETGTTYARNWWVQLGPIIVPHPNRYSGARAIGKNIVNSIEYFAPRIRDRYWDTLVQGHSHQSGSGIYSGINWFENGCCCNRMDFNAGPKQTQPIWTQAYSILSIDNGKLDANNSRLYTGRTLL